MGNQLIKETALGKEQVFPKNYILNLKDKDSGANLEDILKSFNMLFLPYLGNKVDTRKQVPMSLRHGGLWITYIVNSTVVTEWYNSTAVDDATWGSDAYWREGSNMLVGDISISKQGTWVVNGEDTGISPKGDKGDSPVIRIYNNRIQVSYDNSVTYEDLNNTPVYTKFRFNSLTNTYQVSYDLGDTWLDISNEKVYHKFKYNLTTNTYLESTDFGKTWSNISAEKVYTKFRFNRGTNTYQVSTDLGLNWTDVSSDKVYYRFRYNGETNTHLVSTDFGVTWTNVSEDKVFYLFRTEGNRLLVSTDLGTTWENCSEPIAAWFRWADVSGTGNVGKVLISRDNNTWEDLSPTMTNNLYIKGYVSTVGDLPTNSAAIGDIYMVGPTYDESDATHDYPHYRMWVKLSSGWVDNGEYLSNILISLTTGLETGTTMSLKAITDTINAETERAMAAEEANTKVITEINTIANENFALQNNRLLGVEFKTNHISNSLNDETEEAIVIKDNDDNDILRVNNKGLDVKGLYIKGENLLNKLENKQDEIKQISSYNDVGEDEAIIVYSQKEKIVEINPDGVKVKSIEDFTGNKLMFLSYDNIRTIKLTYVKDMEMFKSLGFGMFIHWGVYSVLAGHYNGVNTDGETVDYYSSSIAEWIMKLAKIPKDIYKSYQSQFNASKWDADSIAKMAYIAGMKYIVITCKHHEGFCLFESDNTEWDIRTSAARSTIIEELKNACEKYGLKFCLYFSQERDWTSVGGWGQEFTTSSGTDPYTNEEHQEYVNKTIKIINELIVKYDPFVLWYDGKDNYPTEFYQQFLKNQNENYPWVIVNDRLHLSSNGDFQTGEGAYYRGDAKYVENCYTLNGSWGYNEKYDTEEKTIKPEVAIEQYILEAKARGQNCLLNIGPKGDGSVSELCKNVFLKIGEFMKKYGEIQNTDCVSKYSHPNWGRILKKDKSLKLYVYDKSTEITVYGINTTFINGVNVYDIATPNDLANLEIIDEYSFKVKNIPPHTDDTYPAVIDIYTSNNIVAEKYAVVIDDNNNHISVLSCNITSGSGFLMGFGTSVYSIGGWTSTGKLETYFQYRGVSKECNVSLSKILSENNEALFNISIIDDMTGETQSINVNDINVSSESLSLLNMHTYKLIINKTNSYWFNLSTINFI